MNRSSAIRKRYGRRGFVIAIAVMLIALVAVALAAMSARISTVARQSMQAAQQAQSEQLILAGMDIAKESPAAREIRLPGALVEEGAKLRLLKTGNQLDLEVSLNRTRMHQPILADKPNGAQ